MRSQWTESVAVPRAALPALLSVCVWVHPAVAVQAPTVLRTTPCSSCGVKTEILVKISGERGDLGVAEYAANVVRDARGRIWISFGGRAPLNVFSVSGDLLGRVGRTGQGPGEFGAPMALVPVADSVLVFDAPNSRMTVVGPDLKATRGVRVEGQWLSGVLVEWPRVVLNGYLPRARTRRDPFHVLNVVTGEVERSFGGAAGPAAGPVVGQVRIDAKRGSLWTINRSAFTLQEWSFEGDLLRTLVAPEEVFPGGGEGRMGDPRTPPEPIVTGLQIHGDFAVVHFHTARPTWAAAWDGVTVNPHGPSGISQIALWEGHAALVDLRTNSLLGTWPLDLFPVGLSAPPDEFVSSVPSLWFFQDLEVRSVAPSGKVTK